MLLQRGGRRWSAVKASRRESLEGSGEEGEAGERDCSGSSEAPERPLPIGRNSIGVDSMKRCLTCPLEPLAFIEPCFGIRHRPVHGWTWKEEEKSSNRSNLIKNPRYLRTVFLQVDSGNHMHAESYVLC